MKYILCLLFLVSPFIHAQDDVMKYKKKYPNANEVFLKQLHTMELGIEKGKLNIISKKHEESIVITDDVNKVSSKGNVQFSSLSPLKELEASTYVKNKKYEVKDFRIVRDKAARSFHDDKQIKEFDYTQLALGSKKHLDYSIQYLEPTLLSGDLYIDNLPIEYKETKIIVDKDIELGYKVFNNDNNIIQFEKEQKGNKTIYKWYSSNIPLYKYEAGIPNVLYYAPLVEVYVKSYKNGQGEKVTLLNTIQDLHKLYQNYIKEVDEPASEEIVKTAISLKSKHTNEIDQVKEIYYWVKDNIKYIAFEDGYGGFIPRKANDVFHKRYGDCKDMAVIVYTMLKVAGINNVYLTWIGSREKPFKYEDIATQLVDDHMIATYQNNGKNYFLDCTNTNTPFGYPTSFIQGKQALINKSKSDYELVSVPIVDPKENSTSANIELQIVDNKLKGKSTLQYTCYARDFFLENMRDLTGQEKLDFLKAHLNLGNNKFFLEDYDIKNIQNRDLPLQVDYTFNIDNYIVAVDNEIYVNLFLSRLDELEILEKEREKDYHIENKSRFTQKIKLKIPSGYKVGYLPEKSTFNDENFFYTIDYKKNNNEIILDLTIDVNFLAIKKDKFEAWNKFVNSLKNNTNESISLIKITAK